MSGLVGGMFRFPSLSLYSGKTDSDNHFIGPWVGSRVGLSNMEKRNSIASVRNRTLIHLSSYL
jgi:hypothetical protein